MNKCATKKPPEGPGDLLAARILGSCPCSGAGVKAFAGDGVIRGVDSAAVEGRCRRSSIGEKVGQQQYRVIQLNVATVIDIHDLQASGLSTATELVVEDIDGVRQIDVSVGVKVSALERGSQGSFGDIKIGTTGRDDGRLVAERDQNRSCR